MDINAVQTAVDATGGTPPSSAKSPADPTTLATQPDTAASDAALVSEIYNKYDTRRQMRRPYEVQWYLNASALRGFPDVRWNAELSRLEMKREPAHRKRHRVNHIKPKYVARVAKYTKIPPTPSVIPATSDREDIFNARASQKVLEYFSRKGELRHKFMQAMQWVPVTGKAFWWFHYDDQMVSHSPINFEGKREPILGEVVANFGSAFEFLPADPGIEVLADQPEIHRVRLQATDDIEQRYELLKGTIPSETANNDLFFYQRQIADLGTRQQGMSSRSAQSVADEQQGFALLIETFTKPCAKYPRGRYVVVAGRKLLKNQDSIPGDFQHVHRNPYPCVEFTDDIAPGQFWPDAFVERLAGLASEYNEYRSKMSENLAMHFFPKLVVPKQLNMAEDRYTSEAGERLDVNWIPGIPMPSFLQPASVIGDAWNVLNTVRREMDDVSLIYPSVVGGAGGANSGFQTNLMQEAADQVHGPAVARNAMGLEEAYIKIRHLMKISYTIPRLISIAGKNNIPEVYEFVNSQIDEQADVRIEPESMMPMLRSARVDMIRGMYKDGLYGAADDPQVRKRVMDQIRMGFADFEIDREQRDQEQAQLENIKMGRGEPLPKPQAWEEHRVHWEAHVDLFKSPEATEWPDEQRVAYAWHAIIHLSYISPDDALKMAGEFGLRAKLEELLALQKPPAPPAPPPQMALPPGPPMGPEGALQAPGPDPAMLAELMQGGSLLDQLPPMAPPVDPRTLMGQ